jgi:hypothetical protein
MILVDLPEGQLQVDWDRLGVWQNYSTQYGPSWPKCEDFLYAVRREIKFQDTKKRMQDWMAKKGNQIVREEFDKTWRGLGHR